MIYCLQGRLCSSHFLTLSAWLDYLFYMCRTHERFCYKTRKAFFFIEVNLCFCNLLSEAKRFLLLQKCFFFLFSESSLPKWLICRTFKHKIIARYSRASLACLFYMGLTLILLMIIFATPPEICTICTFAQ